MAAESAAVRSTSARIAALTRWSQESGVDGTRKARTTFRESFEAKVDPNGELSLEERKKRADRAYRAHMATLSLRAAEARRRKAA